MTEELILRLSEDKFGSVDAALNLEGAFNRVLYVVHGGIRADAARNVHLSENQAARFAAGVTATATAPDTVVWRWELLPTTDEQVSETGFGVASVRKLSPTIAVPRGEPLLMRCDRVDFPLGSETPKHTHVGPGIRCLLSGEIVAEIGGEKATYRSGGAWLERGPDPVIGRSSKTEPTAFVRVMVLPRRLKGQSSFRAWDKEEAQKPRGVTYTQFLDEDMDL